MAETNGQTSVDRSTGESPSSSGVQDPGPCYFMVVDILGFSEIIKNLNSEEQTGRIANWIQLVDAAGTDAGVTETQLISDTLFVREEDSGSGLARLLKFARLLIERSLEKNFPLRGAIVHGEAAWGKLTYGDAVIKAHNLERSLEWIGIACEPGLPRVDQMWDWDKVVVYPVPKKQGDVTTMPAVAWNVPEGEELLHLSAAGGLIADGGRVAWTSVSKWERTSQFGIYLKIGRLTGLDPQRWNGGWHPTYFIDLFMNELATNPDQITIYRKVVD